MLETVGWLVEEEEERPGSLAEEDKVVRVVRLKQNSFAIYRALKHMYLPRNRKDREISMYRGRQLL